MITAETIFHLLAGAKNFPNLTEASENQSSTDHNKPTASGLGAKVVTSEVKDWWKGQGSASSDEDDL